jgi:alpha-L-glutamate ligase-like protein
VSLLGSLRRAGVLGINRRNTDYTLRENRRELYPIVDDKLRTKRVCAAAGIPTAKVLAAARTQGAVAELLPKLSEQADFVLKPAHGSMGNGILVVVERDGDRFRRPGGDWITDGEIVHHARSIVSGLYALGGQPDVAFAEERLIVHPELAEIASEGVPDLRFVVFRGIPVMAMTRLPTHRSRGRANLHQGAVGAGIDLASGRTNHAVIGVTPVSEHPNTLEPIVGRALPAFEKALEIAVRATDCTGLGYVGADIVVDARRGPVVLELNARPGLSIQIANRSGLLGRLRAVEARWRPEMPFEERLALGREIGTAAA